MSKLLKTAVASLTVLAALAFGASSAWADAADSLPSLNASDWTGVEVTDVGGCTPTAISPCTFHAHSTDSVLNGGLATCDVDLTVKMYPDGSTEVINGVITPGSGLCTLITTDTDPAWTNQACQYLGADHNDPADDEYWDGIDVNFSVAGTPITGDLYGQLQPGSPFTHIDVDSDIGTSSTNHILANGSGGSAPYEFEDGSGNPITITGASDDEAECTPTGSNGAWSELE